MLALQILLTFLLLILLLLFLPVTVKIGYADTVTLSVGMFGIYIPILPKKEKKMPSLHDFSPDRYRKLLAREQKKALKKAEKAQKKSQKKQADSALKKQNKDKKLPPNEVDDAPSMISILLRIVGDVLNTFFGRLYVRVARLRITVGGEDATKTALTYGAVSQGVAYLLELLAAKTNFHRAQNVQAEVIPNFLAKKTTADILLLFRLRLLDVAATGVIFLLRFIREKTKDNQTPKRTTASLK